MHINAFSQKTNNSKQPNFASSQVNIIATADNHGHVLTMPQLLKTVEVNKKDFFDKAEDKGTLNLFAIGGDFFINPKKKGFLTHPELSNGDIQYNFLLKSIETMKKLAGKGKFDTVYAVGNHCLDGGDSWLFNKINNAPMTTVVTNVNLPKSPLIKKLMKTNPNLVTEKIYEIPDNKNKNLKNHVMVLGLTIPSMNYYNPNLLKETHFYDNSNKNDACLEKKDLSNTFRVVSEKVQHYKDKYPNGAIILVSHTGNKVSKMLAQNIPNIDLVLNGHDHLDSENFSNSTNVMSLSHNNKMVRAIHMDFDDDGNLDLISTNKYYTEQYAKAAKADPNLENFVKANLSKDLIPMVKFNENILNSTETVLDESIKYSNNTLANYVTSAIKRAVRVSHPEIEAVGIPATVFRSGLRGNSQRTTFNNMDLMKMFDGVSEHLSKVRIGKVSGKDLTGMITENVINNLQDPKRNALIQWSDFQVNRTLIEEIAQKKVSGKFSDAIKFKNTKTRKFEPIDLKKEYCILMSDKYLVKNTPNIKYPKKIKNNFVKINKTYDQLFKQYLKMVNYDVKITDKTREKRII